MPRLSHKSSLLQTNREGFTPPDYQRVELGNTSLAELKSHAEAMNSLAQGLCRYYRLDDTYVAAVSIAVHSIEWRVVGHPHENPLSVRLSILEDYAHCDLGDLSLPALQRFIEIKAMFDKWVAGEIVEMPPSTEPQFPVELERKRQG